MLGCPALAACAAPAPPAPACLQSAVDSLSLRAVRGRPVVTASVNGEPVNMLLDTGAETTLLTRAAAARLHLPLDRERTATVTGVDGISRQWAARATAALTGRGRVLDLVVFDLPGDLDGLSGVLGVDVLSDYDVSLDQPGGRITLVRTSGCTPDDAPRPGRWVRLPAAFTPRGRILAPVRLGDVTAQALLDTGEADWVVSPELARRAGVTDKQVAEGAPSSFLGAALKTLTMHTVQLPDVQVGPDRFSNLPVVVPETALAGVNMLLGNDYLSQRRVFISWARQAVFVEDKAGR